MVDTYESTYSANVAKYNTTMALLKAAPLKSAKTECVSAGKELDAALPDLEKAVSKLETILFRKNGEERKIIDWIILGKDLSDALTDLQPRLEKLLPLLRYLDDPQTGLIGLGSSLNHLQLAAGAAPTLSSSLVSCADWNNAKVAHGNATTLATTGLETLSRGLGLLTRVQNKSAEILKALESAKAAFDPARSRIKSLIGDDLAATERRTAALFIPSAPLIYTGEYIKDKLGIGKDRLRIFAGVSEADWKILRTKSNSDAVAKAIRNAIFPRIEDAEKSIADLLIAMQDYDGKLPGIITNLTNAQTALTTLNPGLQASSFPSVACQQCWFAD